MDTEPKLLLMIWGAMSSALLFLFLCFIESRANAAICQEILEHFHNALAVARVYCLMPHQTDTVIHAKGACIYKSYFDWSYVIFQYETLFMSPKMQSRLKQNKRLEFVHLMCNESIIDERLTF